MIDRTEIESKIQACYDAFIACSKLNMRFTTSLRYWFEVMIVKGYSADDIRLVCNYIQRRIRLGKRQKESLKPQNLFSNLDNFEEELSMARAQLRTEQSAPPKSKESVLNMAGRTMVVEKECKTTAQIMQEHEKMAALLKQFRTEEL